MQRESFSSNIRIPLDLSQHLSSPHKPGQELGGHYDHGKTVLLKLLLAENMETMKLDIIHQTNSCITVHGCALSPLSAKQLTLFPKNLRLVFSITMLTTIKMCCFICCFCQLENRKSHKKFSLYVQVSASLNCF